MDKLSKNLKTPQDIVTDKNIGNVQNNITGTVSPVDNKDPISIMWITDTFYADNKNKDAAIEKVLIEWDSNKLFLSITTKNKVKNELIKPFLERNIHRGWIPFNWFIEWWEATMLCAILSNSILNRENIELLLETYSKDKSKLWQVFGSKRDAKDFAESLMYHQLVPIDLVKKYKLQYIPAHWMTKNDALFEDIENNPYIRKAQDYIRDNAIEYAKYLKDAKEYCELWKIVRTTNNASDEIKDLLQDSFKGMNDSEKITFTTGYCEAASLSLPEQDKIKLETIFSSEISSIIESYAYLYNDNKNSRRHINVDNRLFTTESKEHIIDRYMVNWDLEKYKALPVLQWIFNSFNEDDLINSKKINTFVQEYKNYVEKYNKTIVNFLLNEYCSLEKIKQSDELLFDIQKNFKEKVDWWDSGEINSYMAELSTKLLNLSEEEKNKIPNTRAYLRDLLWNRLGQNQESLNNLPQWTFEELANNYSIWKLLWIVSLNNKPEKESAEKEDKTIYLKEDRLNKVKEIALFKKNEFISNISLLSRRSDYVEEGLCSDWFLSNDEVKNLVSASLFNQQTSTVKRRLLERVQFSPEFIRKIDFKVYSEKEEFINCVLKTQKINEADLYRMHYEFNINKDIIRTYYPKFLEWIGEEDINNSDSEIDQLEGKVKTLNDKIKLSFIWEENSYADLSVFMDEIKIVVNSYKAEEKNIKDLLLKLVENQYQQRFLFKDVTKLNEFLDLINTNILDISKSYYKSGSDETTKLYEKVKWILINSYKFTNPNIYDSVNDSEDIQTKTEKEFLSNLKIPGKLVTKLFSRSSTEKLPSVFSLRNIDRGNWNLMDALDDYTDISNIRSGDLEFIKTELKKNSSTQWIEKLFSKFSNTYNSDFFGWSNSETEVELAKLLINTVFSNFLTGKINSIELQKQMVNWLSRKMYNWTKGFNDVKDWIVNSIKKNITEWKWLFLMNIVWQLWTEEATQVLNSLNENEFNYYFETILLNDRIFSRESISKVLWLTISKILSWEDISEKTIDLFIKVMDIYSENSDRGEKVTESLKNIYRVINATSNSNTKINTKKSYDDKLIKNKAFVKSLNQLFIESQLLNDILLAEQKNANLRNWVTVVTDTKEYFPDNKKTYDNFVLNASARFIANKSFRIDEFVDDLRNKSKDIDRWIEAYKCLLERWMEFITRSNKDNDDFFEFYSKEVDVSQFIKSLIANYSGSLVDEWRFDEFKEMFYMPIVNSNKISSVDKVKRLWELVWKENMKEVMKHMTNRADKIITK